MDLPARSVDLQALALRPSGSAIEPSGAERGPLRVEHPTCWAPSSELRARWLDPGGFDVRVPGLTCEVSVLGEGGVAVINPRKSDSWARKAVIDV